MLLFLVYMFAVAFVWFAVVLCIAHLTSSAIPILQRCVDIHVYDI